MTKLEPMIWIAERFIVADLLENDDIWVILMDVFSHEVHSFVIPIESRFSWQEPRGGHRIPSIITHNTKHSILWSECVGGKVQWECVVWVDRLFGKSGVRQSNEVHYVMAQKCDDINRNGLHGLLRLGYCVWVRHLVSSRANVVLLLSGAVKET